MKITVTREVFNKNFYVGSCEVCEHFDEETKTCKIEEIARLETRRFEHDNYFDEDDIGKMDCVCWEYKYIVDREEPEQQKCTDVG